MLTKNEELLANATDILADCFLSLKDGFHVYLQYCWQYEDTLNILEEYRKKPELINMLKVCI